MRMLLKTSAGLLVLVVLLYFGAAASHIPEVVIFQGADDVLTPLSDLLVPGALPPGIELVITQGAGHADGFEKAWPRYIGLFLDMPGIDGN